MERRKSKQSGKSARKKAPTARARKASKKAPKVDISKTALGEEPEKRGLSTAVAKSKKHKKAEEKSQGDGRRELTVQVKTGRYRKHSSTLWLHRQLNDPFVARAKAEGYRSRAAYKLIELDDKFSLIKPGARVVDLGCAPGGWLQVAVKRGAAKVVGIDYLAMDTVAGADVLELDFLEPEAPAELKALLGGAADLVLSDMAAPTTGHKSTDHLRVVALAETALDFALDVLATGGAFACKVFAGGAEGDLLASLKRNFASVKHAKPKASRADSSEKYVVATGFKGRDA